jgi:hypothetical protein
MHLLLSLEYLDTYAMIDTYYPDYERNGSFVQGTPQVYVWHRIGPAMLRPDIPLNPAHPW